MQQRVHVETLLQDLDVGVGLQAELAHPVEEGVLVATVPDAQGLALEVFGAGYAAGLFAGQHQAGLVEHLGHVDQGHAGFTRGQGRGHPVHHDVGLLTSNDLRGCNVGATGLDGDVQAGVFVEALGRGHVVAGKLGLGHPLQLHGDFVGRSSA